MFIFSLAAFAYIFALVIFQILVPQLGAKAHDHDLPQATNLPQAL
jgi:hypothetical protein